MCILDFFDNHAWLTTLFMVPFTVGIAAWQINRQFKYTIKAQRTNKLDELHLSIYKEIADKIEACQAALSKTYATTLTLPSFFEIKVIEDQKAKSAGLSGSPNSILQRYPAMTSEQSDVRITLVNVLGVMDKYEIVFSDFSTMTRHIVETAGKLDIAINNFHSFTLQFLPMDVKEEDKVKFGGAKIVNPPLPEKEALSQIRTLSEVANEINMDLTSYMHDLRIEAQNSLLSPIFNEKKAPKRVPGNPQYQVLTRNSSQKTE